jgi:hypothetical protein
MRTSPVLNGKLTITVTSHPGWAVFNLRVHLEKPKWKFYFSPQKINGIFFMQTPGTSLLPETGKQIVFETYKFVQKLMIYMKHNFTITSWIWTQKFCIQWTNGYVHVEFYFSKLFNYPFYVSIFRTMKLHNEWWKDDILGSTKTMNTWRHMQQLLTSVVEGHDKFNITPGCDGEQKILALLL